MLTNHATLQMSAFAAKPIFKSIQHNDYVCENEHMSPHQPGKLL